MGPRAQEAGRHERDTGQTRAGHSRPRVENTRCMCVLREDTEHQREKIHSMQEAQGKAAGHVVFLSGIWEECSACFEVNI